DDQRVACVLLEEFVRLDVQRGGGNVPDHLIDADDLAAPVPGRSRVAEFDQENGGAADRRHVDGAAERDGQARLQVEAVERVDDGHVRIVRRPGGAVGQGKIDPAAGELGRVGHGESVTREGAALRRVQVERGDGARQPAVFQVFE